MGGLETSEEKGDEMTKSQLKKVRSIKDCLEKLQADLENIMVAEEEHVDALPDDREDEINYGSEIVDNLRCAIDTVEDSVSSLEDILF